MQGASAAQKENQEDDDEDDDDDDDEPEDFMIIPEGCRVYAIEGQGFTRTIVRILPCRHHRPIVHVRNAAQADSIKFCGL